MNVPSGGRVWFASRIAHRAGERVIATKVEAQMESKYAQPIGAKMLPSTPVKLKIGANTTTIITVEKTTANRTSTDVS